LISHPDSPAEVDRAAATSIRCAGSISAPTGGRGGTPAQTRAWSESRRVQVWASSGVTSGRALFWAPQLACRPWVRPTS